ncbi:MAG: DotI/IcmL family type IV secretion protein [Legionellales bacterium]
MTTLKIQLHAASSSMNKKNQFLASIAVLMLSQSAHTAADKTQLAVWANEAIIATYSYDYQNYVSEQKEIAKYFTSNGWINYTKALNASKLPDSVQKNNYVVSAVATQPPQVITSDATHWQATMPILVVFKNPQYQQQQHLKVVLTFTNAQAGQGVRGLSISSLQTTVTEPPCACTKEAANTSGKPAP